MPADENSTVGVLAGEYVDLQVNGYAGVDFNSDELSAEAMHEACARLAEDGVAGVLATIISAPLDLMESRLERIATLRGADPAVRERICGVHIEGPFLNEAPGYIGAHPPEAMRPASWDAMARLLEAAGGLTRLVTLAPERDPALAVTRRLAREGIVVAAGHSDASLDQLRAAIDAGLTAFTHLGNGCPLQMHRHDNIIQRVLALRAELTISLIADGTHLPPFVLDSWLRQIGVDRAVIVTDAISAARLGPGRYTIGDQTVDVGEDLVCRSADASHFIGSTATMPRMAALLARLGYTAAEIRRLAGENPRRLLRMA